MGIEIESPEDFLEDYKDAKAITTIIETFKTRIPQKQTAKQTKGKIKNTIQNAQKWLLQNIKEEKYWHAKIETNAGLSAQFILMSMGVGHETHNFYDNMFQYILSCRDEQGLIGLYYQAKPHPSSNLLMYLAGRALGYEKNSPELTQVYQYLKTLDFHEDINMETKLLLAIYGLTPWSSIPEINPYLILLPDEAEFSIYSIAYWIRTSLIPMAILYHKNYTFSNFPLQPSELEDFTPILPYQNKRRHLWENMFKKIAKNYALDDNSLSILAVKRCEQWILNHQDPSGDWGGIYPAIQYSIIALYSLGYGLEHHVIHRGFQALHRFIIEIKGNNAMQACVSPVWDTVWSLYALSHSNYNMDAPELEPVYQWVIDSQINQEGDWAIRNKTGFGGGWAFQFYNNYYPDTDDTAVVLMALLQNPNPTKELNSCIQRGLRWLMTIRNHDGGWSAFEQGVDDDYVDLIPFNDMENWQDASTADVSGRCLQLLGELNVSPDNHIVRKTIQFLHKEQEKHGSWYGRWGVNHIYGTWSAVSGLALYPDTDDVIKKACDWMVKIQNSDGGWGESCDSYDDEKQYAPLPISIPSQTAWAILTLLTRPEEYKDAIQRGIEWLIKNQTEEGTWEEDYFTGTGFGKYFYLRYDYYRHYFPLLALGKFSNSSIFQEE
ncbi:MAG: squalene--hopene cyclase [Planctomycetes bacterium]|nr:squalene--hopene cyclase [Planctomycetota bacterium]